MTPPGRPTPSTRARNGGARRAWPGVLLLAATFLAGGALGAALARARADTGGRSAAYRALDEFAEVLFHVERDHVSALPAQVLVHKAIQALLQSLDRHSHFYTKEQADRLRALTTGVYGGVGIVLEQRGRVLVVARVLPGSPAMAAGIKPGDRLLSVDGRSCATWPPDRARTLLSGRVGSKVHLELSRRGTAFRLVLTRKVVRLPTEEGDLAAPAVAYLRIHTFTPGASDRALGLLSKLDRSKNLQGVILDLRHNPGGLVSEAAALADAFLSSGTIFVRWTRTTGRTVVQAHRATRAPSTPLVVLVDGRTASAAELLAAALVENRRAVLVGEKTYGKGSIQELIRLRSGALLKLTVGEYLTPSGRSIEGAGIRPALAPGARLPAPGTGISPRFVSDIAVRTAIAVLQDITRPR